MPGFLSAVIEPSVCAGFPVCRHFVECVCRVSIFPLQALEVTTRLDLDDSAGVVDPEKRPQLSVAEMFAVLAASPAPSGAAHGLSQFLSSALPWIIQCNSTLQSPSSASTLDPQEPYEPDAVSAAGPPPPPTPYYYHHYHHRDELRGCCVGAIGE